MEAIKQEGIMAEELSDEKALEIFKSLDKSSQRYVAGILLGMKMQKQLDDEALKDA